MSVGHLIKNRRNIKLFKSDPVDLTKVISWLQLASNAPNHRMTEPWDIRFIGPETRGKLNHKTDFGGAPVVMAILSEPGTTALNRDENMMAVACFIDNFLLCAYEEGVGTGWSSLGATAHSRAVLEVPEGYDVAGIIAVGYPRDVPEPKDRKDIAAQITYLP